MFQSLDKKILSVCPEKLFSYVQKFLKDKLMTSKWPLSARGGGGWGLVTRAWKMRFSRPYSLVAAHAQWLLLIASAFIVLFKDL